MMNLMENFKMDNRLIVKKKLEYIHNIYEMAVQEADAELIDKFGFDLLFIEPNFNSVSQAYKRTYYMIKNTDEEIKKYPELQDEWSILRFKLVVVHKGLYNILHREFDINYVGVGEDENSWTFIC